VRRYHNSHLSFIDLLMNAVAVFAVLFWLTLLIINDPSHPQTKTVDERAKILIVMTWADDSADDMDLWLFTPEPDKVGYTHPNGNVASLARDDLGLRNDFFVDPATGKVHWIHLNKEVIAIREKMDGTYKIDVMFYARQQNPETGKISTGAEEVTVQVTQLDPTYHEVVTRSVMLSDEKDIKTVIAFDIVDGQIVNVDTSPLTDDFIHRDFPGEDSTPGGGGG
jgi:hypothetical protein